MNIYEEAKVITHEEAIKALDGLAQFIIMNDTGTDESASAIEWHNIIKQSITEQQAKEQRAKKVEELLGLYQKLLKYIGLYNASTYCTKETLKDLEQKVKATQKQIRDLEKELEEMK